MKKFIAIDRTVGEVPRVRLKDIDHETGEVKKIYNNVLLFANDLEGISKLVENVYGPRSSRGGDRYPARFRYVKTKIEECPWAEWFFDGEKITDLGRLVKMPE